LKSRTTILLPVHNAERMIRSNVLRILDLAEILGRHVQVAIVDDGSTDETFEAASELMREFPQVCVLRQPYQRGVGAALEQASARLGMDVAIAHDGATPLDLDELADVLNSTGPTHAESAALGELSSRGSRRICSTLAPVSRHFDAHVGRSFRWLRLDGPLMPRRRRSVIAAGVTDAAPAVSPATNTFTPVMAATF
jgi:hypothetical protein